MKYFTHNYYVQYLVETRWAVPPPPFRPTNKDFIYQGLSNITCELQNEKKKKSEIIHKLMELLGLD